MTVDIQNLRGWIGRTEETTDVVTAWPLKGLSATLDRDDPAPVPGDPVPPGGHWLYFLDPVRTSELDADGHAKKGGFLPPVPFSRRMWAGNRLEFLKPLRVGETVRRKSVIRDVAVKEGRSGPLAFVRVHHEVFGPDGPAVREDHDIVWREGPPASPPEALPAPGKPVWQRTITPDAVLLFRYSALTFNGHRIHFDYRFTTEREGYPGLLVHGPLIATLLMDLCRRHRPGADLERIGFRAVSPLFDTDPFTIAGEPSPDGSTAKLWAVGPGGALAMRAEAEFRR